MDDYLDTNECELNTAICGIGRCVNTVGNYTCICPDGHMLTPDNNCMGASAISHLLSDFLIQFCDGLEFSNNKHGMSHGFYPRLSFGVI